jgi:hypothetical protein
VLLREEGFDDCIYVEGFMGDGEAHAWLECNGTIIDPTSPFFDQDLQSVVYEPLAKYPASQVVELMRRDEYYHRLENWLNVADI